MIIILLTEEVKALLVMIILFVRSGTSLVLLVEILLVGLPGPIIEGLWAPLLLEQGPGQEVGEKWKKPPDQGEFG